jgi:hypothetical protein
MSNGLPTERTNLFSLVEQADLVALLSAGALQLGSSREAEADPRR